MSYSDFKYLFFTLNLWLCPMSIVMVGITALALKIPLNNTPFIVLLPFLLFYVIYVEDRRSPAPEDKINHPQRSALVQKYSSLLHWSEAIGFMAYQLLLIWFGVTVEMDVLTVFGLGQIPFVIVFSYGFFSRYPLLDSLAVGFTWAYMAVFPLLIVTRPVSLEQSLPIFAGWFVLTFAGSESRNVEDIEGDDQAAKPTLAGWVGRPVAPIFVVCLKSFGVVLFWIYTTPLVTGLVVGYLFTLRLFRELTESATNNTVV